MANDSETQCAVSLRDVRFAWRKGLPDVLSIRQFQVGTGERVFVAGASGTGKSTLLALLGGVNVPREGNVAARLWLARLEYLNRAPTVFVRALKRSERL